MAKLDKLITYAFLKEEIDVPDNLPDGEFEHKIYRAQEMLRMLMGDEFYQDFLTNYKNGTLSSAYTALYSPYVKQFVAWQAHEFWSLTANFKITRSGYRVHTEDNSQAASDVQMGSIIKDAKQQGQYYKKLLVSFLNGNSANYPLYSNNCTGDLTGNTFHVSAVKNCSKHDHDCNCNRCRC